MKETLARTLAFTTSLILAPLSAEMALAQSTVFTYQGRLEEAGVPADGPHDFRFGLFDAAVNGAQVGSTLCVDDVDVVHGLFTVPLDFGQQFNTTVERHLEIEVRQDIGQPCTDDFAYILLSPRQLLTATPLASHAISASDATNATHADGAFALDAADGSPTSAVFVDDDGNVGVGTTAPTEVLHVSAPTAGLVLQDSDSTEAGQLAFIALRNSAGAESGLFGFPNPSNFDMFVWNERAGGGLHLGTSNQPRFTVTSTGNVGIGTTTPATAMHMNGQALWLTGGNGGGLPVAAGGGLRLYDDGVRANIFAFNYANGTPRTLTLQEPGGNVGIGTTSPDRPLAIAGTGPALEWLSFKTLSSFGSATLWHINGHNNGWNLAQTGLADGRLFVGAAGDVGVGTDAPLGKLDVRGNVKLGPGGQYFAPGGEENLRIIRGTVEVRGSIIAGSGFTVSHEASEKYTITFDTPFAGVPTITATTDHEDRPNDLATFIQASGVTASSANLEVIIRSNGDIHNQTFHFIAIGPR